MKLKKFKAPGQFSGFSHGIWQQNPKLTRSLQSKSIKNVLFFFVKMDYVDILQWNSFILIIY